MMLIEKSRLKTILRLSGPMVAGMLAQQLISLTDTAMVGQLGNAALASLGVSSFIFMLLVAFLQGVGAGVQAMVARRIGEGTPHLTGLVLNVGLLISITIGLVLIILGYLILPFIMSLVNQDPEVIEKGISYLTARIPSIIFVGIGVTFGAYWNGVSLPKFFLLSIVIVLISNVAFNYILIFGKFGLPRLGVQGAGLGSTLATVIGVSSSLILGWIYARKNGFLKGFPEKERIITFLKVSAPESIRMFFFFLAIVLMYTIVGMLETRDLAAFNVIINIMLISILPAVGMGMAAMTLVSESLGRKEPDEAKKWGWETAKVGAGFLIIFGVLVLIFAEPLLRVFIVDAETIQVAKIPLQIVALITWIEAFSIILTSSLIGAGATKLVMIVSLSIQWGRLPLHWFVGVYLGFGLNGIFINVCFLYLFNLFVMSSIWHKGKWSQIKI